MCAAYVSKCFFQFGNPKNSQDLFCISSFKYLDSLVMLGQSILIPSPYVALLAVKRLIVKNPANAYQLRPTVSTIENIGYMNDLFLVQ